MFQRLHIISFLDEESRPFKFIEVYRLVLREYSPCYSKIIGNADHLVFIDEKVPHLHFILNLFLHSLYGLGLQFYLGSILSAIHT